MLIICEQSKFKCNNKTAGDTIYFLLMQAADKNERRLKGISYVSYNCYL